jgi:hypothetical protein
MRTNILTLDNLKNLVNEKRDVYKIKHSTAKSILAKFKADTNKNLVFNSLNSLTKHLKGDPQVIR